MESSLGSGKARLVSGNLYLHKRFDSVLTIDDDWSDDIESDSIPIFVVLTSQVRVFY